MGVDLTSFNVSKLQSMSFFCLCLQLFTFYVYNTYQGKGLILFDLIFNL
jgi:hypothetical protein